MPSTYYAHKSSHKKIVAAKTARRNFVEAIASGKPTPEVERRHQEAAEAVSRAKRADFLQQYRAAAKD